jgi:hypothetical protein
VPELALTLRVLPETLAVVRLGEHAEIPGWAFAGPGVAAVLRRDGELTIACASDRVPAGDDLTAERDWRAIEVQGPLDFALTGILAALAGTLAEAGVSIFALSTYDTDVLLVRAGRLDDAVGALRAAGHVVGA